MSDQFVVPQFIDVEDKILGPITARQFIIMLAVSILDAVLYKILTFSIFLAVGIPLFLIAGVVAFLRVNGQPFHFFILNLVQTLRRPRLRVWDKRISEAELRRLAKVVELPPPPKRPTKPPLASSRLAELVLSVNTGGVYKPEE